MPSARDLMQKADSLMRSNRSVGVAESDQAIPVLTDVVIRGDASPPLTHKSPSMPEIATLTGPLTGFRMPESKTVDRNAQLAAEQVRIEADQRELAEAVYFEVLRDLDVESGDGMRERLSAQLQPVFEQLSRDIVDRLQQSLTDAVRDQVAAAIERKLGVPPLSHKGK